MLNMSTNREIKMNKNRLLFHIHQEICLTNEIPGF